MPSSEPEERSSADLRAQIARLEEENAELRRTRDLLRGIADHAPAVIYVKDREGRFAFSNDLHAQLLGRPRAEVIGKREADLLPPEVAAEIEREAAAMLESGTSRSTIFEIELSGKQRAFLELMFPIRDEQGAIIAVGGIANEITESRRAEERNAALQAEIIETQRRVIREISAPLLPIADGVVVLPLVGSMSQERGALIAHALLDRIHADRVHTVLFDATGMPDFEDGAFQEFLLLLGAMRLLGARALLTGISAKLAPRFLAMGDTLKAIETVSTVQAGIAMVLQATQKR